MRWSESAIVIAIRAHGETSAIATVFTGGRGKCRGLVRGGRSARLRTVMQPGTRVLATWSGRLEDQLGSFACEPTGTLPAAVIADAGCIAVLQAACALIDVALPAGEPHRRTYDGLVDVLDRLAADPAWPAAYLRWELTLLADLGFGLDLSRCAATGSTLDLAYVSPRTGRAVSRAAGDPYRHKLLNLPAFLIDDAAPVTPAAILAGLTLTGYFLVKSLGKGLEANAGGALPEARQRLPRRFAQGLPRVDETTPGAGQAQK